MRMKFRPILHILSFFLVLTAVYVVWHPNSVAFAADRMYTFNMEFNGMQGNLILVESGGQWGLVDTGHRKTNTIRDESGQTIPLPQSEGYSNMISMRNGKDVAQYMVNVLGVDHLDFIVGTHSHMDHIGGVPEIATTPFYDTRGQVHYLVDSNTTYFYKEYQHLSDVEDDLARYSSTSYHNQAFYYEATQAMQARGANMVDVSQQQVVHGDPGNAYGDYVTFTMGNMTFRLYNVYEQTNTGNENVNSIVTVMTNGNYTVVNLSDINTGNAAIDNTSRAISKDFDSVDVVVAGHHGYPGSNTKTMFDELQPDYVVISNGSGQGSWLYTSSDLAAAIPYAEGLFGTKFFSTGLSPYAIVTDLSGNKVYVYNLEGNGALTDAFFKAVKSGKKDGWVSWMNTEGTLWSYLENGKPKKNTWQRIDGKMYHFDNSGIMSTGWFYEDGRLRFLDASGALTIGWKMIDGQWHYFEKNYGAQVTGWQRIDGKMYYFDGNGAMQTGWVDDGTGLRYCDSSGALVTGWKQIGGTWYYFESSCGYRVTNGWQRINGKMYYFGDDGIMRTGWVDDGTGMRFCDSEGALVTGWEKVDGRWYYFESSHGYRAANSWQRIDGKMYYFDEDGSMHTGWHEDGGGVRFCDYSTGELAVGKKKIDGNWYYFESSKGYRLTNTWQRIDGNMYYFGEDGAMKTGWIEDEGGTRWCDPESGALVTGWKKVDGRWFYFESSCGYRVRNAWQRIDGKMYYFDDDGSMHIGWLEDEGGYRYCDSSGALVTGWQKIDGKWFFFEDQQGYVSPNGGWQRLEGKMHYFDGNGDAYTGWLDDGTGIRYLDSAGALTLGWGQIDGNWYYFESSNGYRLSNCWQRIDGKMYYFNDDGTMHTGWLDDGTGVRWMDNQGVLAVGWRWVDDQWYFFEDSCGYRQAMPGWQRIDGVMRYFDENGVMQKGWLFVEGKTRFMDDSGALVTGWRQIDDLYYYFYPADGNLARDTTVDGYYVNPDGVWVQ